MEDAKYEAAVYGEVLYDSFPDGKAVLGGAPFNVAWHLHGLGVRPLFISAVGNDPPGRDILRAMHEWGMDCTAVQVNPERPTGTVRVHLEDGQPSFDILPEQAYDYVTSDSALGALDRGIPGLLYHGTLIARSHTSRATLERLLEAWQSPAFVDLNLRAPWWRAEDVVRFLERARWAKVNDAELRAVAAAKGLPEAPLEDLALRLRDTLGLDLLVVTLGAEGAFAADASGGVKRVSPSQRIEVVDTVGAGDAFSSVVLLGLIRRWDVDTILHRAQVFAETICGIRGATVQSREIYSQQWARWGSADA